LTEKGISELMLIAGRTSRTKFRDQVLKPLLKAGWLEMTIPDKPCSSRQKYQLTEEGRRFLAERAGYPE
jgi:predicted transcriptional regulator